MHELLRNFIDGEWVESATRRTVDNVNPADTRQVLGKAVKSSKEDTNRAIDSAKRAFASWRKVPAPKRGTIIFDAMRIMSERREEMAQALTREEGKTLAEARGELAKSIALLEFRSEERRVGKEGRARWSPPE